MPVTKAHAKATTLDDVRGTLDTLVEEVQHLRQLHEKSPQWWHDNAGRFENDPVFNEIARLGRQSRNGRPRKRK
jgi:hypothetical protein